MIIRNILKILLLIFLVLGIYLFKEGNKVFYIGEVSNHYNGKKFHNYNFEITNEIWDVLLWQFYEFRGDIVRLWPKFINDFTYAPEKIENVVEGKRLKITFINHMTFLIQTGGKNILMDPFFSKRVSPFNWLGPKRYRNPGIRLQDLPKIDYILVSHDHFDHCDIRSLKKIQKKFGSLIIAGLGMKRFLADFDLKSKELDWWEGFKIQEDLSINFVPALHWSGRLGILGNDRTLWGGFVINTTQGNLYFSGDTAFGINGKIFSMIKERFNNFFLAILPIGAYEPRWFMKKSHINPEEAVKIHKILGCEKSIAGHYGTFGLSQEGEGKPEKDLRNSLENHEVSAEDFMILRHGEYFEVK